MNDPSKPKKFFSTHSRLIFLLVFILFISGTFLAAFLAPIIEDYFTGSGGTDTQVFSGNPRYPAQISISQVSDPILLDNSEIVNFRIGLDFYDTDAAESFCIESILLNIYYSNPASGNPEPFISGYKYFGKNLENACYKPVTLAEDLPDEPVLFSQPNFQNEKLDPYYAQNATIYDDLFSMYPFDRRDFYIEATMDIRKADGEIINLAPDIHFVETATWEQERFIRNIQIDQEAAQSVLNAVVEFNREGYSEEELETLSEMSIPAEGMRLNRVAASYTRPFSEQFIPLVIFIAVGVFLIALMLVKDSGTAFEVSVGLLVGLWGIQGVVIPSHIHGPTAITRGIQAFYLLFAVSVIIRFLGYPYYRKLVYTEDEEEKAEIENGH